MLDSAHLFDTATNTFTMVPTRMTHARAFHMMDLLPNGDVLISGGIDESANPPTRPGVKAGELYHPGSNTFSSAGADAPHSLCWAAHAGCPGGAVLWGGLEMALQPAPPAGGSPSMGFGLATNGQNLDIGMTYTGANPAAYAVSFFNTTGQYYNLQPAFASIGGKLFMAGGQILQVNGSNATLVPGTDALLADTNGAPTAVGSLANARWAAAASEINSGDALVVGGDVPNPAATGTNPMVPTFVQQAEYWNHTTSGFVASVNMLEPRIGTVAVRLKNGSVAVIGGSTGGKDDMLGYDGTPTPTIEIYSK